MDQVPKQPNQQEQGFAFEGEGSLQVGSARKAADTGDDEFDYAFKGQDRQAVTHKKEFKVAPIPAHLVSNVRQQPLGSLGEQEEEEEEHDEPGTAIQPALPLAQGAQQQMPIPSQLAALVADATANVAAGLPSNSAQRLIAGAAATSLSNNSMTPSNGQAVSSGRIYMVGGSAGHVGVSGSMPGSAFPTDENLALGSNLVIETVDSQELLLAHTEELADPAADQHIDNLSVGESEDAGDMSPAVEDSARHPTAEPALDQAVAERKAVAGGMQQAQLGMGSKGAGSDGVVAQQQQQPRRAQMQLPTPQLPNAEIIPNSLLTSITGSSIPAAVAMKPASIGSTGSGRRQLPIDENSKATPGLVTSGKAVQGIFHPSNIEGGMRRGSVNSGPPPALLALSHGTIGQAAGLKQPSVSHLSSFAAASLDPGTTMSEPAPVERMLHFMQARGNSLVGTREPLSSHTCSSAVMELPSMALLRAISRDARSCELSPGMCFPATDTSLPSSAILSINHNYHNYPGSAPAAAPGFSHPVLQALQPVMPLAPQAPPARTQDAAVAGTQKAQDLASYLRGMADSAGVPQPVASIRPADGSLQEQNVSLDAQARAAAAAGTAALAQLRSSSSIRSRSGLPLNSASTGYTTAPTSSQDHGHPGLNPSIGSTPAMAALKPLGPYGIPQPGSHSGKLPSRDCHDGWEPLQTLPLQPAPIEVVTDLTPIVTTTAIDEPHMPVLEGAEVAQAPVPSGTVPSAALGKQAAVGPQERLQQANEAPVADSNSIELSLGGESGMPIVPLANAAGIKPAVAVVRERAPGRSAGRAAESASLAAPVLDEWEQANLERQKEAAAAAAAPAPADWARVPYSVLLRRMEQEVVCTAEARQAAERQLQTKGGQGFLSKLLCMVRPPVPHALQDQKVQLLCWAATPYNNNQPLHWDMLTSSYAALTGLSSPPQRHGSHWQQLGWQGSDPATDLRGCGVFGLLQLCSLCDDHPALSSALYKLSRSKAQEFPLAIVSLNCTKFTLQALREGSLDGAMRAEGAAWRTVSDFHAGALATFYRLWTTGNKTMAQSGFVIKEVEEQCRSNSAAILKASSSSVAA